FTEDCMAIKKSGRDPEYINEFSRALLDGFYLRDGETFDEALARAANAFSFGDEELAQRIYEAAWKGWFMFASPILSNAPVGEWSEKADWSSSNLDPRSEIATPMVTADFIGENLRAMPISCFAMYIPDSIDGQMDANRELAALSVAG